MTRSPYRVGVWGTGALGGALLRETIRLESLELVCARAYSQDKIGHDVGEVIGIPDTGVIVSGTRDEIIAARPDVVLYVPLDTGAPLEQSDDDMLELLGAGINVITALAYRGLRWRDRALERFEAAAKHGGSTFFVAGVNPDFVCERLVMTLSALCSDIQQIRVREIFRADTAGELMFAFGGFGLPVGEIFHGDLLVQFGERYFEPSMRWVAEWMGRPLDRVVGEFEPIAATADIVLPTRTIAAGTMARMKMRWVGFTGDAPFYVAEADYYCGPEQRPADAVAEECWIVEIEGRPSIRAAVDSMASLSEATMRYPDDPTSPGYYATAVPLLQAIAPVVDGAPGVMHNEPPALHYTDELWGRPGRR